MTERQKLIIERKIKWGKYRDSNVSRFDWQSKYEELIEETCVWWKKKIREVLGDREESCVESFLIVYNGYELACKTYYQKTFVIDMRMDEIEWVLSLYAETKEKSDIMTKIRRWRNSLAHGQLVGYPPDWILQKARDYYLYYYTLNGVYDYFFN